MAKSSAALVISLAAFVQMSQVVATQAPHEADNEQPCELGRVHWNRDFQAACRKSAQTGAPLFVLFQEVPGCDTCQDFGNQPLSQPLMVEAIETLFIPVLVYNNQPDDTEMLARFKEPSWNNPVIRYLDANGQDVIPRKDRVWSLGGTASRMIEALEAAGGTVPVYLRLLANEANAVCETATFAMHCFWEGEAKLGSVRGVLHTKAAFFDGREVVRLSFDPSLVDYRRLAQAASQLQCATRIYPDTQAQASTLEQMESISAGRLIVPAEVRSAPASDQHYYLSHSSLRYLPLTPLQAVKVNAALGLKRDPAKWLSPRQIALWREIKQLDQDDLKQLSLAERPDGLDQLPEYDQQLRDRLRTEASAGS